MITHYNVYATGGGTTRKKMKVLQSSAGSASISTFVTGLKTKTAYTFEVTAINSIGESAHSTATAAVTTQAVRKYIFVSDFTNDRVLRFDHATKAFKDVFVQKGSGGLKEPQGIAFNKYDDASQPRTFYVSSGHEAHMLLPNLSAGRAQLHQHGEQEHHL